MGLGFRQVSNDGLEWSRTLMQKAQNLELPELSNGGTQQQQHQQQSTPLKCPRCDSTNTKFCYYNNYKKSQPRHFCKSCKRHWTKDGTLRNVPVGGGRKNKRLKTSKTSTKAAAATARTSNNSTTTSCAASTNDGNITNNRVNPCTVIQARQLGVRNNASKTMYQALITQSSSGLQQNSISCDDSVSKSFNTSNNGIFLGSTSSLPQNQELSLACLNSGSFETNPSSISACFHSSNLHNYSTEGTTKDSIITTIMPTTGSFTFTNHQQWQVPNASCRLDMSSYWNWEDLDTFVSSSDLDMPPWDDYENKP